MNINGFFYFIFSSFLSSFSLPFLFSFSLPSSFLPSFSLLSLLSLFNLFLFSFQRFAKDQSEGMCLVGLPEIVWLRIMSFLPISDLFSLTCFYFIFYFIFCFISFFLFFFLGNLSPSNNFFSSLSFFSLSLSHTPSILPQNETKKKATCKRMGFLRSHMFKSLTQRFSPAKTPGCFCSSLEHQQWSDRFFGICELFRKTKNVFEVEKLELRVCVLRPGGVVSMDGFNEVPCPPVLGFWF